MKGTARRWRRIIGAALALASFAVQAQAPDENPLGINLLNRIAEAGAPEQISGTLTLVFILTVITLAPAILVMTTSFVRIIVVFGFLRQAMATQQSPPNQVLIGLALFLTAFIMWPTYTRVYNEAIVPYTASPPQITPTEAWERGMAPIREFMFRQTRPKDLALFISISRMDFPEGPDDVPTTVLIPAFVVSELTAAFKIGFLIYIPFLIIDMVVASTLMAMGMMMLPPVFVSLPFKIIMFVLADGWYLLIGGLVQGFDVGAP